MEDIQNLIKDYLEELSKKRSILEYRSTNLNKTISDCVKLQGEILHQFEILHTCSKILQNLIDIISTENIYKLEQLVNSALKSIFWDLNIEMKIEQEVKRNIIIRNIVIYKDGRRGTIKSNGGGIWAVIAVVLKVLCNVLKKNYPLIVFDESMSFVADKYVPSMVKFLGELSENMNLVVSSITHNILFKENSLRVYNIDFEENKSEGEEPFIKVELIER
jgi:hypothetical protein